MIQHPNTVSGFSLLTVCERGGGKI